MKPFAERYDEALDNPNVRDGLLAFQRSWRTSRDEQISMLEGLSGATFDELRERFAARKRLVTADLDGYVAAFTEQARAAGSTVVTVADAAAARAEVARLCHEVGAGLVVKGKSMVTEEIGLNEHLEHAGLTVLETDLGEWLLQIGHDRPSHLVMPAIHKRRHEIAATLTAVLHRPFPPDDIERMVRAVRTELRSAFLAADVGISGANALIAESGTVMIVCNEGNNRLSVSLPPVHVVVVGIEKLLPRIDDAVLQARLLARSATGQPITSYTTFLAGPRPGQRQHIVLVDNGRRTMSADTEFSDALACIRCGACANVCPPYQVVGGHVFGHVYTGAIGLVNTAFHHGLDAAAEPQSLCVSCGACTTVCPSSIPLAEQILTVRRRVVDERGLAPTRRTAMWALRHRRVLATIAAAGAVATRPFSWKGSMHLPFARRHVGWRRPPVLPLVPARRRSSVRGRHVVDAGDAAAGRLVVSLFMQCLSDRLAPQLVTSTIAVLEHLGAAVVVPPAQHCCGLPAFDCGDWDTARRLACQTIEVLERSPGDIVTPATSCLVAIAHEYPRLFADDPAWAERGRRVASRLYDLAGYLRGPAASAAATAFDRPRQRVAVHRFCQGSNVLGRHAELEDLLARLCGADIVPLAEAEVCCGFGGSTSLGAPEVAAHITQRKLTCIDDSGADIVVTENPGCVLHLRGGVSASGRGVEVLHLAEVLARCIPTQQEQRNR
ncbi:MAG: LUD domain-containing protein [Ilumatobacteraceae bacterium]